MATDAEADVAIDAGMECIRIPEAKRATRATADTGADTEAAQIEAIEADTGADVAGRASPEAAAKMGAETATQRSRHEISNMLTSDARSNRPKIVTSAPILDIESRGEDGSRESEIRTNERKNGPTRKTPKHFGVSRGRSENEGRLCFRR